MEARANARVAQTSRENTFRDTIVVALRSGAVAGLVVVSLAVLGISVLFFLCHQHGASMWHTAAFAVW